MYWVLIEDRGGDGAILSSEPEEGPKGYVYDKGLPLLSRFPDQDKALMFFDSDFPDCTRLYDTLPMLGNLLVANSRVRRVLGDLGVDNVEYLPVRLLNHARESVSDDYCIVHVLGSVDFIDMEKSEVTMSALIKDRISFIDNLRINYDAIPDDIKLIRASNYSGQLFIHDDLKQAFEAQRIKGYKVFPADGWDGLPV